MAGIRIGQARDSMAVVAQTDVWLHIDKSSVGLRGGQSARLSDKPRVGQRRKRQKTHYLDINTN